MDDDLDIETELELTSPDLAQIQASLLPGWFFRPVGA